MRLFEFEDANPLRTKLVAVTNQLASEVKNMNDGELMTTDELVEKLKQNDIIIDKSDLFDIVTKEPLKNIIKNINGDEVVFKGQKNDLATSTEPKPDENQKTLAAMAKKAMK